MAGQRAVSPDARFAAIVESLRRSDGVTPPEETRSGRRFGAAALKVNGKIFAMLVQDRLVVKLPRQHVDALIAAGDGDRFVPGHGRPMKEWVAVGPASASDWLPLAREALAFVAANR